MKTLWKLIVKDFKILLRSKLSASLMVFGPLFLVVIVGLALSAQDISDIKIGVYGGENEYVQSAMEEVATNGTVFYDNLDECVNGVGFGIIHSCIEFPEEFVKGTQNDVNIYVDLSRVQLAMILGRNIRYAMQHESVAIGEKMAEEIISIVDDFKEEVNVNIKTIDEISSKGKGMKSKLSDVNTRASDVNEAIDEGKFSAEEIELELKNTSSTLNEFRGSNNETIGETLESIESFSKETRALEESLDKLESNLTSANEFVVDQRERCTEKKEEFDEIFAVCYLPAQCDLVNRTKEFLIICINDANDAEADLMNLSREINETRNSLDTIKVNVNETASALENTTNVIDSFFDESNQSLSAIDNSIKEFKIRLNDATGFHSSIEEQVGSLDSFIDESLKKTEDLKTKFVNIDNKINEFPNITAKGLVEPINPKIKNVLSYHKKIKLFFPYLVVIVIMLVCVFSSITMVLEEKETRASMRNFVSPTKPSLFILSTYITVLLIALSQVVLMLVAGKFLFYIPIFNNLPLVLLGSLLTASVFIFLGMLLGYMFDTVEVSMVVGVCIAALFLLISPIAYPIEGLSPLVGKLAPFNPFVLATESIRKLMIVNTKIVKTELLVMLGYSVYLWLVLKRVYKKIRVKILD